MDLQPRPELLDGGLWLWRLPCVLKMATLEGGKGGKGCLHQHRSGDVERRGVRDSGSVLDGY